MRRAPKAESGCGRTVGWHCQCSASAAGAYARHTPELVSFAKVQAANLASHSRVAFASMASNTGSSSPGELEMTRSTSEVAVCCSNASAMARAAVSTSRKLAAAIVASVGLRRTATRVAPLAQEFQPLRRQLRGEKIDTRQIATRPSEAGDKTEPDRVFGHHENDGDRRRRLGCGHRRGRSTRHDHGDASADQVGCQHRQSIDLIVGPAVFDRHVLALDIADVLQALAKCAQIVRVTVGRCGVKEPDHGPRAACVRQYFLDGRPSVRDRA